MSAKHADVARQNIAHAGLGDKVEIRTGAALETLPKLEAEGLGPFDFVFIDADKTNNAAYLEWALRLSRPGTTIMVDNVVREGQVVDAASSSSDVVGVRRMFEIMAREPRLSGTAIQTVGAKGWDGFALAIVSLLYARSCRAAVFSSPRPQGAPLISSRGLGFLGTSSFPPKTLGFRGWKSLDFLGFSRPNLSLFNGLHEIFSANFSLILFRRESLVERRTSHDLSCAKGELFMELA